jgi:antitoxin YefM
LTHVRISVHLPEMKTISATDARSDLYNLIDRVGQEHEPVQITSKRGSAVLIAMDDFAAMEETLYLLNIRGMRESILEGMNTPVSECSDHVDL